jgi:amidophosphoribosyltransferase
LSVFYCAAFILIQKKHLKSDFLIIRLWGLHLEKVAVGCALIFCNFAENFRSMSDAIKHECGIALIKLKKPLQYYVDKYGTAFYAMNKLYLLMEKQHNRGQDGVGVANIKFDVAPGERYISRQRSVSSTPIKDVFSEIQGRFQKVAEEQPELLKDAEYLKEHFAFTGELWLGHLRYGTFGKNKIENCHPFLRQNNWMTRNLVVAGNFNLTNVDELFSILTNIGQHPKEKSDTVTVLEKIGHFLDDENLRMYYDLKEKTDLSPIQINAKIAKDLDVENILKKASEDWDGGYAMAGLFGHGDSFVMRDPSGIRPVFYYQDDEVVVVTSERPVIQTAFNVSAESVKELTPGCALLMKKTEDAVERQIRPQLEKRACSFERIYFSRGNDGDIYNERKKLGELLAPRILEELNHDFKNTVFSFIPNTAEVSFYGLINGVENELDKHKAQQILALGKDAVGADEVNKILSARTRIEKIAIKDAKLRTFITQDDARDDLVAHVYDTTYGTIEAGTDTLVMIDDSIVRGTTLKQSILRILDRLGPKQIVVVSSAPQIRYPDCYGIDMAKMGDFAAFQAAIALLNDHGLKHLVEEVYHDCKLQEGKPKEEVVNHVKRIYAPFTDQQISDKMAELLCPADLKSGLKIMFQTIEDLHIACPMHKGDWYFSGDYPTPGGNKVVNKAFINFVEGKNERAY